MGDELFRFNISLFHEVQSILSLPYFKWTGGGDKFSRMRGMCSFLERAKADLASHYKERPAETLYYALINFRTLFPSMFLASDLCLLMANAAIRSGAKNEVALMDPELLPTAILLAGTGRRVVFTESIMEEIFKEILNRYLPEGNWSTERYGYRFALGRGPFGYAEKWGDDFARMTDSEGGVFYSGWDFIGVQSFKAQRKMWLKAGFIDRVLQLPRPRGQVTDFYPAVFSFSKDSNKKLIRLATMRNTHLGRVLRQEKCIELMFGKPGTYSVDVPVTQILQSSGINLTPGAWFIPSDKLKNQDSLDCFAEVLRFQGSRERIHEQEIVPGLQENGDFIAREVGLAELDSQTGFVNRKGGGFSRMKYSSFNDKYLLRKGDILFLFRGTDTSIGQIGFMAWGDDDCLQSVPGRSMYIIRPLPGISPVWLYYSLRKPEIRNYLINQAVGSSLLTINIEAVRDLPWHKPEDQLIKIWNRYHSDIVSQLNRIEIIRDSVEQTLSDIEKYKDPDG